MLPTWHDPLQLKGWNPEHGDVTIQIEVSSRGPTLQSTQLLDLPINFVKFFLTVKPLGKPLRCD
jgi:hypothetical protein